MKNNENNERDGIIEELWRVKDGFSHSCGQNVREFVKKMNKISESLQARE